MSWPRNIFLYGVFFILAHVAGADVMVQLNINRPINDISDKFISFTIKPEDLYKALDSSNRKIITRMASLLSHSHVKFVGDYYFAAKTEGIRLRNPTKIIWKGFNKWTKAVNWTMIIPVPYKPDNWDPMETLKILNTSNMVDIDEAIWQLGNDFGTSRAEDYVSELKTFNIMVDSFKDTVTNWQTIGADISAGSSPEETRRYVEMSRDLNVAYGWIQSDDMFSSNSIGSAVDIPDPALKVLFKSKVPVWLSLPKKKTLSLLLDEDEVTDGLNWAQNMGEAANVGFESIFKPLTLDEMEKPNYGFYVTALFKKVMGSRVYPARPLGLFGRNNKLYTHCANMVSGGLAFMVVNKQEEPLQIVVKSMNKLQDTEVWQYALTMQNGQVMLNDNELNINSLLLPEVRRKNTKSMLILSTPGLSVSFWVLPDANLEHCHFREVETPMVHDENSNKKIKRYSSSDRLLKELIKESAKPSFSPFAGLMRRQRRSVNEEDRFKRFVLEGTKDEVKPFTNLAESLVQEIKAPLKKHIFSSDRRIAAVEWLNNVLKDPLSLDLPLLKRNVRHLGPKKGPFFMTPDGRKIALTKKTIGIKKPERKVKKIIPEDQEFDEEKFFKNVGEQNEPEYMRIPEGDVFLSNISSMDSDEVEEGLKIETKKPKKAKILKKEIVSEVKPLRLLPTEYFEALPAKPLSTKASIGSALNSLLFSDSFGKTYGKTFQNLNLRDDTITKNIEESESHKDLDVEEHSNDDKDVETQNNIKDIKVLSIKRDEEEAKESSEKLLENLLNSDEDKASENSIPLYAKFLPRDNLNVFRESTSSEAIEDLVNEDESVEGDVNSHGIIDETPWWDLSSKRSKRSLDTSYSADSWHNNVISKNDDSTAAAHDLSPIRLRHFEHKVDEVVRSTNSNSTNEVDDDIFIGKRIVNTLKEQVTKLVDIFSHHATEWYNTFTKQLDSTFENTTTNGNRVDKKDSKFYVLKIIDQK